MTQIRKYSLVYDAHEDRVAWDAEDADGGATRLWLTQRLCRGLVEALLPMLQAAAAQRLAEPRHLEAVQSWEQAAAMADFGKLPGVRPQPQSLAGLVRAVHIAPHDGRVELTFDFGEARSLTLGASHPALRQTLFVLRGLYQAAGWPLDIWPAWVSEPLASPPADAVN